MPIDEIVIMKETQRPDRFCNQIIDCSDEIADSVISSTHVKWKWVHFITKHRAFPSAENKGSGEKGITTSETKHRAFPSAENKRKRRKRAIGVFRGRCPLRHGFCL
jgi:hypothetical protein